MARRIFLKHRDLQGFEVSYIRANKFAIENLITSTTLFYRIDLEEEDALILASDGLLDNLYDQEIASEVSKYLAADSKPEEIAEALTAKPQEAGKSALARSPFADRAQPAGTAAYTGGKLDDVTVIVSVVQRQSSSQA